MNKNKNDSEFEMINLPNLEREREVIIILLTSFITNPSFKYKHNYKTPK